MNDGTDIASLAAEIVDKCSLIPPAKLPELEQLLFYLQKRKDSPPPSGKLDNFKIFEIWVLIIIVSLKFFDVDKEIMRKDDIMVEKDKEGLESTEVDEVASLQNIDTYSELLYEDTSEKIRASALLLQLSRNPDNLGHLAANG